MMINNELKQSVVAALNEQSRNYPSGSKHAVVLGISPAQYSKVKNGQLEQILSEAKWVSLARRLNVQPTSEMAWKIAHTEVFEFIYTQLEVCQEQSISGVLCDVPDIGKTCTAQAYARRHGSAVYIDCSQFKNKQKLVRAIAREFGVDHTGTYNDTYQDLVYYLRTIPKALIILDEVGDLQYDAWLELKALWNATENHCGWYMMGADGLEHKINKNIDRKKVGYTELFSRFGNRFQRITPQGRQEREQFLKEQASMIAQANGATDLQRIIKSTGGSHRRVRIEIRKQRQAA